MSRPRNIGLNSLLHYRFPPAAIASILHRISGVLLVLSIPFLVWLLSLSLQSAESFARICIWFNLGWTRLIFWVLLSALAYHVVAGIKHLLMDLGWFEEKVSGQVASVAVMLIAAILIVGLGVWIW